jgi:hypothetical protein
MWASLLLFSTTYIYYLATYTFLIGHYKEWHHNSLCALENQENAVRTLPTQIIGEVYDWLKFNYLTSKTSRSPESGRDWNSLWVCTRERLCQCTVLHQNSFTNAQTTRESYMGCIIDLVVKAFDTADHELLFLILKKYGIPESLILVIAKWTKTWWLFSKLEPNQEKFHIKWV